MFKKILEKLASMTGDGTAFGGDVHEALVGTVGIYSRGEIVSTTKVSTLEAAAQVRACYDLGLLVALPPPQDGEVEVHAERAQALLDLAQSWRVPTAYTVQPEDRDAFKKLDQKQRDAYRALFELPSDDARTDVFAFFCRHCGKIGRPCYCECDD